MKLITTTTFGNKAAKVYFNSEFDEYQVKLYVDKKHQTEADYFTNDKADAVATSEHMVGMKSDKKPAVKESVIATALAQLLVESAPALKEASRGDTFDVDGDVVLVTGEKCYYSATITMTNVEWAREIESGIRYVEDFAYDIDKVEVTDEDGEEMVIPPNSPNMDKITNLIDSQVAPLLEGAKANGAPIVEGSRFPEDYEITGSLKLSMGKCDYSANVELTHVEYADKGVSIEDCDYTVSDLSISDDDNEDITASVKADSPDMKKIEADIEAQMKRKM